MDRHPEKRVYSAWVDGAEAIVRCDPPADPLGDPRSAFYGGQGLVPPFRNRAHHEAFAWARVEPRRVLAHGVGPEGPYVALRRLPGVTLEALAGERPFRAAFVEAMLGQVATELAALHAAGVLHRDLRPGTVLLVDGEVRLAGLANALVDGLGPPLPGAPVDARGDLHALGGLARWALSPPGGGAPPLGETPLSRLGERLAGVVEALLAPDPRDRPASANEVLAALGEPQGPPPALLPPHPALQAWSAGAWADRLIAQRRTWDVVRRADEAGLERWALAALAGRILSEDPYTDAWLAVGTLCWMLADRVPLSEMDAYRAQATEARARADAAWHPASRGLGVLLERGEDVGALCDTAQPRRAARRARAEGGGGALALVGWKTRDDALVEEGLAQASPTDALAIRVAASRVLVRSPREAPLLAARYASPNAQLDAVRSACAQGAEADAARLAASYPEPVATRARLVVALYTGERAEAIAIARVLATRGHWDPTVAATIVAHAGEGDPLKLPARRLLVGVNPPEAGQALGPAAAGAVARDPTDTVGWSNLVYARVSAGEIDEVVAELEATGTVAAWRLLVLELVANGHLAHARVALLGALRRFPGDARLSTLDATLSLLDGDFASAVRAAEHASAQDPTSGFGALARAACALWIGDVDRAGQALDTARKSVHSGGEPVEAAGPRLVAAPLVSVAGPTAPPSLARALQALEGCMPVD